MHRSQILNNRNQQAPLVVRQQAEPLGNNIRAMSDSEVYQDDHVPEGARPNRWQSLHFVCRYEHHHKPVYPLQHHLDVWHMGASG